MIPRWIAVQNCKVSNSLMFNNSKVKYFFLPKLGCWNEENLRWFLKQCFCRKGEPSQLWYQKLIFDWVSSVHKLFLKQLTSYLHRVTILDRPPDFDSEQNISWKLSLSVSLHSFFFNLSSAFLFFGHRSKSSLLSSDGIFQT